MDLTSKKFVKNLLREHGVRLSKRMGQNFLVRRTVLQKIIETSNLKPKDIVLEIGPGIGTLTRELAQRVKKVIAIEKDPRLIEILRETSKDFKNVKIIHGDILKFVNTLPGNVDVAGEREKRKNYKVVSNLPYNIATEVIRKFLEIKKPAKLMVVMIQKEVGQRICSKPPRMERLGVLVQFLADVKIIETIKKDSFWPSPKVDSVILKLIPHQLAPHSDAGFRERFSRIVKVGFSHPRKQLVNNFSQGLNLSREKVKNWLLRNNIQSNQRAESLSLEDWLKLTKTFK